MSNWPLASILTIVFVVLKLLENIDWSWWWVLSPLWISTAFGAFMFVLMGIVIVIAYLVKK